jgi:hypothetical protein
MVERTQRETIQAQGGQLIDQMKRIVHVGNVRRIVIKQGERTVAEFPLTIGVVGVVLAPVFAAVGALAALLTDCTIEIEREAEPMMVDTPPVAEPVVMVPILTEQTVKNGTMPMTEPITP